MDVIDRLRTLLRPCTWVRDAATALRLVPELAVDLPSPIEVVSATGEAERGIPVRCAEALAGPVANVVLQLTEASLDGKPREELHRASADRVLKDPLVPLVAELLAQSAGPGLNAQGIPALVVAWLSSRILQGAMPPVGPPDAELAVRIKKITARLGDQAAPRRGAVLADVTWGLRGRLAAAVSIAQAGGWTVDGGGLYRRVMAEALVLTFPRGALDNALPFGVLSSLLGLPIEEELASSIEKAAAAVLPALVDRRARGKATPTDDALANAFSADLAAAPTARGVLFDLWSGPLLIASLPDLADSRLLQKAGVSKNVATALLRREVVRALAASWRDLTVAVLSWDVLSAVCSRILPLRNERGRWSGPNGKVVSHARWDLLVPRPVHPAAQGALIAVSLGPLRARASKVSLERKQPLLAGAADGAWARLTAEHPDGLFSSPAEHGLGYFPAVELALDFARRARKALGGPGQIGVGYLGEPIDLPPGFPVSIGIAVGELRGGTDGSTVWLDGPAVTEAISLAAPGPVDITAEDDPSGVQGAIVSREGLRSRGIVCSPGARDALVNAARAQARPVHVREKGGLAGGLAEDFTFYPIQAWWEQDDTGTVVAALSFAGTHGPVELLIQERSAFANLHHADAEIHRTRPASRSTRTKAGTFGSFAAQTSGASGASSAASSSYTDPFAAEAPTRGPGGDGHGFHHGMTDPFAVTPPPPAARSASPAASPVRAASPAPPPPRAASPVAPPAPPPRAAPSAALDALFPGGDFPLAAAGPAQADPFADDDTWVPKAIEPSVPPGPRPPTSRPAFAGPPSPMPLATADLEEPSADLGALFGDAPESGPAVSIEDDDDAWGGDAELDLASFQRPSAPPSFGFARGPETASETDGPEMPAETTDAGWDESGAGDQIPLFDDPFGMGSPTEGTGEASNLLQLEGARGGVDLRIGGAGREPHRQDDVAEVVARLSGGALLDASEADLTLGDAPRGRSPAFDLTGEGPRTWGEPGQEGGGGRETSSDDPSGSQDLSAFDLGESRSGKPAFAWPTEESDPFAAEPETGTGFAFADDESEPDAGFPPKGDPLPDWETGSFEIEDSGDLPSSASGAFRWSDVAARARPTAPPVAERAPTPLAQAPGRAAAAPSPPERSRAPSSPSSSSGGSSPPSSPAPAGTPDFDYLFQGYAFVEDHPGEIVFGRLYGKLLVDAHAYNLGSDREAAHRAFLEDKIREGFVLRTDLSRTLPAGKPTQKLDLNLLIRAYRAMV